MKKNIGMICMFAAILWISFSGCQNQPTEETATILDKEAFSVYESLIDATDAEVVTALGEGEVENYPGVADEGGTAYEVLWNRNYKGCPFGEQGDTTVRFFFPEWEDVLSGAYQEDPRKVSCVIFTVMLQEGEEATIYDEITEIYGSPTGETAFDPKQDGNFDWEGKTCNYTLWYFAPTPDNQNRAGITFGFLSKSLGTDMGQ